MQVRNEVSIELTPEECSMCVNGLRMLYKGGMVHDESQAALVASVIEKFKEHAVIKE